MSFLKPSTTACPSCSNQSLLPAVSDLLLCPLPLSHSPDPVAKFRETLLKPVCLSLFPRPLIQSLIRSLRISSLNLHLPTPNSIPETPVRIQAGSRLCLVHSLSVHLTLRCCPFISDHTEEILGPAVGLLQTGRREKPFLNIFEQTQLIHEITWFRTLMLKPNRRLDSILL